MGYIKEIKINTDTANLIEPILYGTTNTAAGTQVKEVSISNFELVTGVVIAVKFTVTNTYTTPQLNVNKTGAKPIKYRGGNLSSADVLSANRIYQFVYDGTNWELIGDLNTWRSISDAVNSTSSDVSASSKAVKTAYDLAAGKVSKSGDTMTGDLGIIMGDTDKFVNFWYNTNKTAGGSWRIGGLGTGSGDSNYFVIQSGTNNVSKTTWNDALRIGQNTYNIATGGNVYPLTNNSKTLGTSSNKWSNVYATTFTGNLTGNVTGNATNVTGIVDVTNGGTGASTKEGARSNLGLGTMATETAADYLKLSGGTMTGPLQWTSNALPEKTNPNYFLAIDAFADGGKTYWVGKANVKATLLDTNTTHNNTFLRKDGTWQTPPYPVTSVAGNTGAITADTLRTSLGLSNAMHFLGVTSTNISTGTANTTATVIIGSSNVTAAVGDVVLYGSQEYVWGNNKWNLLGDESSYKVKQTAKSDPTASTTTSTTFIDTISQDANGVITATKKTLPSYVPTSAGVTAVTWDGTNKKLTRTINGTTADVVTIGTIKTALNLAKGDVGLGNVTNHAQVTSLQWDTTNKKLTYKVSESTTATNLLTFAAGSNISLTADTNKITIANTYKAPVDSVAGKTGAVTLVKGDVGLDNVDNTADANKTVKYANMLTGFSTRAATMTWGNQTGSVITYLSSAGGGGWGFRDNNPASGQLSMTIDGTIYIKEGAQDISAAIKSLSVSGQTVTWTNLWGTTGTITTQDTKNTAGSTNSTSKLYLIGATSQAANPTTNSYQYTYTNNGLLSALKVGLNLNGTEKAHLEWNNTDQSIDFVFD